MIIMDGIGMGRQDKSNAVYVAKTPVLDQLFRSVNLGRLFIDMELACYFAAPGAEFEMKYCELRFSYQ